MPYKNHEKQKECWKRATRMRREQFKVQGLNTRGAPYTRGPYKDWSEEDKKIEEKEWKFSGLKN